MRCVRGLCRNLTIHPSIHPSIHAPPPLCVLPFPTVPHCTVPYISYPSGPAGRPAPCTEMPLVASRTAPRSGDTTPPGPGRVPCTLYGVAVGARRMAAVSHDVQRREARVEEIPRRHRLGRAPVFLGAKAVRLAPRPPDPACCGICCLLHVVRCMLHVVRGMLHVVRYMRSGARIAPRPPAAAHHVA